MKIIIGVGIPGCGKTTYLKPKAKEFELEYINPDDIREEITGNSSDHSREVQVWDTVNSRVIKALRNRGAVIDATYSKAKDRRQIIELCRKHGAKEIIAYWFNLPLEICIERNAKRQRVVPENAIVKMHNRLILNPPNIDEGFTKIIEINNQSIASI